MPQEQEFDLQPIDSPVKGTFDLQPVAKDQGPIEDTGPFVGPMQPETGMLGKLKRTADQFIGQRLNQLSGEEPGILNPEPDKNILLNKPIIEPIPRNQRYVHPELFPTDDRSLVGKAVDATYDTGAQLINSLFSPLGAYGTLMGSNPADMSLEATGLGVTKPTVRAVGNKLEMVKEPSIVPKGELKPPTKFKDLQAKVDAQLADLTDETGSMYLGDGRKRFTPEEKEIIKERKAARRNAKEDFEDSINPKTGNPNLMNKHVDYSDYNQRLRQYLEDVGVYDPKGGYVPKWKLSSEMEREANFRGEKSIWDSLKSLDEDETGVLRLRGKKPTEVEDIRNQIIKTVASGGKLNLAEMYQPFQGKVSQSQFSKIVDDILESGDLQRAYQSAKAAPPKPASLSQAISNVRQAISNHLNARQIQDEMVTEEKARRAGKLRSIEGEGVAGFSKKASALKGEYPKATVEPIRNAISDIDLDELMSAPEKAFTDQFQRFRAQNAIAKVFGLTGENTPLQPNEIKLLQQTFGDEVAGQLIDLHGGIGLVVADNPQFGRLREVANLTKSLQASIDLSAPLRQGLPMMLRSEYYPAFAKMFSYAGSEAKYQGLQDYLTNTWPERELAKKSGLSITGIGSDIAPREEHFLSALPEKIPVFGKAFRGSERAYVGFIDKLRSDVFTSMINDLRKAGVKTESMMKLRSGKELLIPSKEAKAVARYINVATGRGSLGRAEKYGDLLNTVFYSPRFQTSRIQLVTDPIRQWSTLPKTVRKEYLKSLLAVGGFVTAANGLGYALGGEITTNPTSSDFGKIKSGKTREDPGAGFLQYLVLSSQLAMNEKTNPVTGQTKELGEGYRAQNRGDVLQQFARYKLAPLPQYGWSAFTGKNAIGQEFDPNSESAKLVIPLLAQDITDILKEDPSLASLGKSIPAIFGVGLNTFEDFKKKTAKKSESKLGLPSRIP